jgi:O-antigen/teichoic acid export membrane protein
MFWRGVLGYLPVNILQGVVGLLTIVLFTRVLTRPSTASTPWPSRSAA